MTRQVTNLLLLYQSTFPLHPSQPHVYSFFNLFFFFSNTWYTHHKSSTPLRTLPTLLTIKRLFFHSSVLHKIHISLSLSLFLRKLDLLLISIIPSSVPLFLTKDLQIPLQDANFNAKHKHSVSFSLSSIANLKKKRLYCKNLFSPLVDLRKKKIFTAKKAPLQICFSNFAKLVQPFRFSILRLNQLVCTVYRF